MEKGQENGIVLQSHPSLVTVTLVQEPALEWALIPSGHHRARRARETTTGVCLPEEPAQTTSHSRAAPSLIHHQRHGED